MLLRRFTGRGYYQCLAGLDAVTGALCSLVYRHLFISNFFIDFKLNIISGTVPRYFSLFSCLAMSCLCSQSSAANSMTIRRFSLLVVRE